MKNTKNKVEENNAMGFGKLSVVREVRFLYAKIKNQEVKKFIKEMVENGFYARVLFEKDGKKYQNGYALLFVFQPTEETEQLIEGQEVFRNIEDKNVCQYAEYGFISLRNIEVKLIRTSQSEYDIQRGRAGIKVMTPLSVKNQERMEGFWDANFWSKQAVLMSEKTMPLSVIQQKIDEYMTHVDMSTESIIWRRFENYCQQHLAIAS